MRKHIYIYSSLFGSILVLSGLFILRNLHQSQILDESRTVFVKQVDEKFQLVRNGKPFNINGACGNSNLELLAEIGGNTIRIYDTTNIANILDQAQKLSLAVIVDIDIPKSNNSYSFYIDKSNTDLLKKQVKELVNKYCDHPALLMWNLGNEVNYPYLLYKGTFVNLFTKSHYKRENCFIQTFNDLIDIIHRVDPNHPVSTTFITTTNKKQLASIYLNSPNIDLLSFNIFGGLVNYDFRSWQLDFLFGEKPYYISEWGSDGPWFGECESTIWKSRIEPTSIQKIEQIKSRYSIINRNISGRCLGGMLFYWGQKQECTHTWFSLFDQENHPSEICYELKNLWKTENKPTPKIGLEYMLVNKKGARDNIIFKPLDKGNAELVFKDSLNSNLRIIWELYPDTWHINSVDNEIRPPLITDSFITAENNSFTFVVPEKEGPYRIFAYVYDQNGYFATTNTPFYVLNSK